MASREVDVTTDVPHDVDDVLTQLLSEARAAFREEDIETGLSAVSSASTVAEHKLPEGRLRGRLLHGCEETNEVAGGSEPDTELAAEYVHAMERLLTDEA